jgi:hypothetical protein
LTQSATKRGFSLRQPSNLRQAQEPWYPFFLFSSIFRPAGRKIDEKKEVKYLAAAGKSDPAGATT